VFKKTYNNVLAGNYLCNAFPIQMFHRHFFNSAVVYVIWKVKIRKDWNLIETHQLVVYTDDVNILDENINTVTRNIKLC
jgi:hypothetical protein